MAGASKLSITVNDEAGNEVAAELVICSECRGATFFAFIVVGQKHPHLQCFDCGATYCTQEGGCQHG